MRTLPYTLPSAYETLGSAPPQAIINTGSYDVMIANLGFRLASDQNYPYVRESDKYTATKIAQSNEIGEHNLSPLPWIKSQSSFHGGAGQVSAESALSPDDIAHLRFDTSMNADVWTPGKVTRLPDTEWLDLATLGDSGKLYGSGVSNLPTVSRRDQMLMVGAHKLFTFGWPAADTTTVVPSLTATMDPSAFSAIFEGLATTFAASASDGTRIYVYADMGSKAAVLSVNSDLGTPPVVLYKWATAERMTGLGWVKDRLIATGTAGQVWQLDATSLNATALPAVTYTHPLKSAWVWGPISESPSGVLVAGSVAGQTSSILKFTLDTSGGAPILSGGATIATLPANECLYDLSFLDGSFLAMATNQGVRVASFDTYTGSMKYGPVSVETVPYLMPQNKLAVRALASRDRFVYAGVPAGQADGTSGLTRLDLSMPVDQAGRLAHAPDLRIPAVAPAGTMPATIDSVTLVNGHLAFLVRSSGGAGIAFEGFGPGVNSDSWVRTSRIRFDTTEPKLFKLGRVRGSLNTAQVGVSVIAPYGLTQGCGTFGDTPNDPGEFRLIDGTWEWVQMQFALIGTTCELNSYQVKALPQERRQRLITFTVACFKRETSKSGQSVTDPAQPRDRMLALEAIEQSGGEVPLVEFTPAGAVKTMVIIEALQFGSPNRPTNTSDIGGYITVRLRTTET